MNLERLDNRSKPSLNPKDFSLTKFVYVPSNDNVDNNLVIYLHGLGDNLTSFVSLSEKLNLPQTASLILQGPIPVPFFDQARMWYESFDMLGNLIHNPDPRVSLNLLSDLIFVLINKYGWSSNNIHLFGFAQGGSVAVEFARLFKQRLGSVITVLGPPLSYSNGSSLSQTPLCVFTRPRGNILDVSNFKKAFENVVITEGQNPGDEMPKGPNEWNGILKFLSDLLIRDTPINNDNSNDGEFYRVIG